MNWIMTLHARPFNYTPPPRELEVRELLWNIFFQPSPHNAVGIGKGSSSISSSDCAHIFTPKACCDDIITWGQLLYYADGTNYMTVLFRNNQKTVM